MRTPLEWDTDLYPNGVYSSCTCTCTHHQEYMTDKIKKKLLVFIHTLLHYIHVHVYSVHVHVQWNLLMVT